MPDNTILNPGVGGDVIRTEQPGGGSNPKIPVSKMYLGDVDIDDGPVSKNNPLPIFESPLSGTPVVTFGEVTLVPTNTETTIVSYTVPPGGNFYMNGFVVSGDVNAVFNVYSIATKIFSVRNTVANLTLEISKLNTQLPVPPGQTVIIKAIHQVSGVSANFSATILGRIVT